MDSIFITSTPAINFRKKSSYKYNKLNHKLTSTFQFISKAIKAVYKRFSLPRIFPCFFDFLNHNAEKNPKYKGWCDLSHRQLAEYLNCSIPTATGIIKKALLLKLVHRQRTGKNGTYRYKVSNSYEFAIQQPELFVENLLNKNVELDPKNTEKEVYEYYSIPQDFLCQTQKEPGFLFAQVYKNLYPTYKNLYVGYKSLYTQKTLDTLEYKRHSQVEEYNYQLNNQFKKINTWRTYLLFLIEAMKKKAQEIIFQYQDLEIATKKEPELLIQNPEAKEFIFKFKNFYQDLRRYRDCNLQGVQIPNYEFDQVLSGLVNKIPQGEVKSRLTEACVVTWAIINDSYKPVENFKGLLTECIKDPRKYMEMKFPWCNSFQSPAEIAELVKFEYEIRWVNDVKYANEDFASKNYPSGFYDAPPDYQEEYGENMPEEVEETEATEELGLELEVEEVVEEIVKEVEVEVLEEEIEIEELIVFEEEEIKSAMVIEEENEEEKDEVDEKVFSFLGVNFTKESLLAAAITDKNYVPVDPQDEFDLLEEQQEQQEQIVLETTDEDKYPEQNYIEEQEVQENIVENIKEELNKEPVRPMQVIPGLDSRPRTEEEETDRKQGSKKEGKHSKLALEIVAAIKEAQQKREQEARSSEEAKGQAVVSKPKALNKLSAEYFIEWYGLMEYLGYAYKLEMTSSDGKIKENDIDANIYLNAYELGGKKYDAHVVEYFMIVNSFKLERLRQLAHPEIYEVKMPPDDESYKMLLPKDLGDRVNTEGAGLLLGDIKNMETEEYFQEWYGLAKLLGYAFSYEQELDIQFNDQKMHSDAFCDIKKRKVLVLNRKKGNGETLLMEYPFCVWCVTPLFKMRQEALDKKLIDNLPFYGLEEELEVVRERYREMSRIDEKYEAIRIQGEKERNEADRQLQLKKRAYAKQIIERKIRLQYGLEWNEPIPPALYEEAGLKPPESTNNNEENL